MSKTKKIICNDLWSKTYKVNPKDLKFRPSVYAVITRDNKVLLSPQWDGYDFPGGGMNLGETIEEALVREVWEETGYKVKMDKIIHCSSNFFKPDYGNIKYMHTILIYYTAKIIGGKISTKNFDKEEKTYAKVAEWIDIKNTKNLKYYNSVNSPALINEALKIYKSKKPTV